MPRKKNTALRIIVPLGAAIVGLVVVYAAFQASQKSAPGARQQQQANRPAPATPQAATPKAGSPDADTAEPQQPAATQPTETPPAATPEPTVAGSTPTTTAPSAETIDVSQLAVRPVPIEDFAPIGSLEREAAKKMRIEFSRIGAGVESIRLAGSYVDVDVLTKEIQNPGSATVEEHTLLQAETVGRQGTATPLAIESIEITSGADTATIDATFIKGQWGTSNAWRQTGPGAFELLVVNAEDAPVLRVSRRYVLDDTTFDLRLDQEIQNLTGVDLIVRLNQFGAVDMPQESIGYGGDKRRVRFGYLPNTTVNPTRQVVTSGEYLMPRAKAVGKKDKTIGAYPVVGTVWPNEKSLKRDYELAWAALTNRYYGVALHPLPAMDQIDAGTADKRLTSVESVERVLTDTIAGEGLALRFNGAPIPLAAGATAELDLGVYAGPLSRPVIRQQEYGKPLGLDKLVIYNFGGMCAFCTFAFLTDILLWLLLSLHKVTFDWALSIILLVVVVRLCLHPITKWSQIRLQVFGKQMQGMAPKQAKIKEKYGDDPKRMQQEMAKLWREEGINPAGMLGCLPMFLQTPVWIALYATLYFSIELRHNPAFFGVFQQLGGWGFMADLASPDTAIPFARDIHIPFISGIMGPIKGINILPLFLGVVFYAHQKYLTPQTSATMTPEQEQQQKIIRFMTVVMFPIFMYNAPSGLALYFITNSTLAIFENRHIRAGAEKKGLLDLDKIKARKNAKRAHKPSGGFFARLQEMAEKQQQLKAQMEQNKKSGGKAPPPGGGKRNQPRPSKPEREDPNKRFKKR